MAFGGRYSKPPSVREVARCKPRRRERIKILNSLPQSPSVTAPSQRGPFFLRCGGRGRQPPPALWKTQRHTSFGLQNRPPCCAYKHSIKGISLLCCAYKHSMAVYSVSRTTYVVVFSIGRAGVVVPARHTSKRKAPSERELSPKVTGGENLIFLFSPSVSAYIEPPPSQREALNTVPQKPKIQAIRPFDIEKNFTRERKITEWKNELFPSCWRW